mmetsp:Transcript_34361/g.72354  ORF Transcript_34361/g.72354 Transcript_34361/m.72354 type:complete len:125 (-) Transcript_34361:14-388(-)
MISSLGIGQGSRDALHRRFGQLEHIWNRLMLRFYMASSSDLFVLGMFQLNVPSPQPWSSEAAAAQPGHRTGVEQRSLVRGHAAEGNFPSRQVVRAHASSVPLAAAVAPARRAPAAPRQPSPPPC